MSPAYLYAGDRAADNWQTKADKAAQKVIDQCWAISQADRDSGVTSRMRHGSLQTALCIEKHILFLSSTVLYKGDKEAQNRVKSSLEEIHKGVGKLYWDLHNSHAACQPSCGSMYTILHNGETAHVMEKILRDFYRKIAEFNDIYEYQWK